MPKVYVRWEAVFSTEIELDDIDLTSMSNLREITDHIDLDSMKDNRLECDTLRLLGVHKDESCFESEIEDIQMLIDFKENGEEND